MKKENTKMRICGTKFGKHTFIFKSLTSKKQTIKFSSAFF